MSIGNALGFTGFGLAMWILPVLLPGCFPHTAIDGSSTRALWVELMGLVQLAIGLWHGSRGWGIPAFRRWLTAPDIPVGVVTAVPAAEPVVTPAFATEWLAAGRIQRRAEAAVAAAVFRNHSPQSLVQLAQPDVVDFDDPDRARRRHAAVQSAGGR